MLCEYYATDDAYSEKCLVICFTVLLFYLFYLSLNGKIIHCIWNKSLTILIKFISEQDVCYINWI